MKSHFAQEARLVSMGIKRSLSIGCKAMIFTSCMESI